MEKFKGRGFEISRVGLGCMRMSVPLPSNRKENIKTIHTALDEGINLINTGDFYGFFGHNEKLIGEALKGRKRDVYKRQAILRFVKFIQVVYSNNTK